MFTRTNIISRNCRPRDRKKGESTQEFTDRCSGLAQKILCKTDYPLAQRIRRENAERVLLGSFVSGLVGTRGTQVRYANFQYLSEELRKATSVQAAEKQELFNESFTQKWINLYVYCLDRPAENAQEVGAGSTQLMRLRSITHIVSEIGVQEMPVWLRPRALGTRRLGRRYVVTNAKE